MDLLKPLTCSEVGTPKVLRALLRRELGVETEDRVLGHLRRCPSCLSVMATVLNELDLGLLKEPGGPDQASREGMRPDAPS